MVPPTPSVLGTLPVPRVCALFSPDNKPPVFFWGWEHESFCCIWWDGIRECTCFLKRLSTNHPEFSTTFTLHLLPPIPAPQGDSAVISGLFLGSPPPPPMLANSAFSYLPCLLLFHLLPSFKNTVAFVSSTVLFVLVSLGPITLLSV